MNLSELNNLIEEAIIEESIGSIFSNKKYIAAAALLLGLVHSTYTYPKIKSIVSNKIQNSSPEKVQSFVKRVQEISNTPEVKDLEQKLDKISTPLSDKLVKDLSTIKYPEKTPRPLSDKLVKDVSTIRYPSEDRPFMEKAYEYIKQSEGVRRQLYKDIYGNWTIGIGYLVKPGEYKKFKGRTLSDKEIWDLFKTELNEKLELIKKHFGSVFYEFSDDLKVVILDGYYRGDLSGSPKTRMLLRLKRFPEAAREYLKNAEYEKALKNKTGVATRMRRNAEIIAKEKTNEI